MEQLPKQLEPPCSLPGYLVMFVEEAHKVREGKRRIPTRVVFSHGVAMLGSSDTDTWVDLGLGVMPEFFPLSFPSQGVVTKTLGSGMQTRYFTPLSLWTA